MRLKAPWLKRTVLDDADDGNYVISKSRNNITMPACLFR